MENFKIHPYIGVGTLRFGMRRDEVAFVLGSSDFSNLDLETQIVTEYRRSNGLQTCFDQDTGKLVMVSFYSNIDGVSLNDVSLVWPNSKTFYEWMLETDCSAKTAFGISIFFKYGVSSAGLSGNEEGNKSITVFQKGQWDSNDPALKNIL